MQHKDKPIQYEPHPVTPERRQELIDAGFRIIDVRFKPIQEAFDEVAVMPDIPADDDENLSAELPDRWRRKHGKTKIKLANQYTRREVTELADAEEILEHVETMQTQGQG